MVKKALKWAPIAIGILAILITVALAVPVKLWRKGEVTQPELQHLPPAPGTVKPRRGWVDTDAACGNRPETRPGRLPCAALTGG